MDLDLLLIIITISDDSVGYIMALSKVIAKRGKNKIITDKCVVMEGRSFIKTRAQGKLIGCGNNFHCPAELTI